MKKNLMKITLLILFITHLTSNGLYAGENKWDKESWSWRYSMWDASYSVLINVIVSQVELGSIIMLQDYKWNNTYPREFALVPEYKKVGEKLSSKKRELEEAWKAFRKHDDRIIAFEKAGRTRQQLDSRYEELKYLNRDRDKIRAEVAKLRDKYKTLKADYLKQGRLFKIKKSLIHKKNLLLKNKKYQFKLFASTMQLILFLDLSGRVYYLFKTPNRVYLFPLKNIVVDWMDDESSTPYLSKRTSEDGPVPSFHNVANLQEGMDDTEDTDYSLE